MASVVRMRPATDAPFCSAVRVTLVGSTTPCAPNVLELVLQFDLLRHRDPVLRDGGRAEGALEHYVAALGPESHLYRIGEDIYPLHDAAAGAVVKLNVFRCHGYLRRKSLLPFDYAHDVFFAHHEQLFTLDLDRLAGVLAE